MESIALASLDLDAIEIQAASLPRGKRNSGGPGHNEADLPEALASGIPAGSRDDWFIAQAGSIHTKFADMPEVGKAVAYQLLSQIAEKSLGTDGKPFPKDQVAKCVESAFSYDRSEWRSYMEMFPEVAESGDTEQLWMIEQEVKREKAKKAARKVLALDDAVPASDVQIVSLRDVLAMPAEPEDRIKGIMKRNGRTIISAEPKAGKTVLGLNLVSSLLSGDSFLGEFAVDPLAPGERVAYFNTEVSLQTIGKWANGSGCDLDRLIFIQPPASLFLNDESRKGIAQRLREQNVKVVVIDPIAEVMRGVDENSASEVRDMLAVFSDFCFQEVGAEELILIAHTGKTGSSVRGSSYYEGWHTSTLRLIEEKRKRSFTVRGRDVIDKRVHLSFDEETWQLTSRPEAADDGEKLMPLQALTALGQPPFQFTQTQLVDALQKVGMSGHKQQVIDKAKRLIEDLMKQGRIQVEGTEKRPKYRLTEMPPELLRQVADTTTEEN